jgi:hypothetical protein
VTGDSARGDAAAVTQGRFGRLDVAPAARPLGGRPGSAVPIPLRCHLLLGGDAGDRSGADPADRGLDSVELDFVQLDDPHSLVAAGSRGADLEAAERAWVVVAVPLFESQRAQCLDGVLQLAGIDEEVDVVVPAQLPADQGVDAPAEIGGFR